MLRQAGAAGEDVPGLAVLAAAVAAGGDAWGGEVAVDWLVGELDLAAEQASAGTNADASARWCNRMQAN